MSSQIVQQRAALAASYFQTTQRQDEAIATLKDDAPGWIRDAVREAHDGKLPDDWTYATAREAFEAISEAGELDTAGEEFEAGGDVYTSALIDWMGSHSDRIALCDEAFSELGASTMVEAMAAGQSMERRRVFEVVREACEDDDARYTITVNMPGYLPEAGPYEVEGLPAALDAIREEVERAMPDTDEERDAWDELLAEVEQDQERGRAVLAYAMPDGYVIEAALSTSSTVKDEAWQQRCA